MNKVNKVDMILRIIVLSTVMVVLSFASAFSQRTSAADMAAREKQNLYDKVKDLTTEQKSLLDEMYDEYAQSYTELYMEARRTRSYDKLRAASAKLNIEKDSLIRDVLNDAQFVVYRKVSGTTKEEDTNNQYAQSKWTAQGILADGDDGSELVGATVFFLNIKDSIKSKFAVADYNGVFKVENLESAFYRIDVRSIGYKPYSRVMRISAADLNLGRVFMQQDSKMLKEVEVKGEVVAMELKGDTVLYNADAYKVNSDASTKDLISKMPGIVVDGSGVSAHGETVQQVLMDGKRFFGQDPLLSLNTIPAEVVKKIEVFDQKSEQSQLTGFDDGNTTKTINVVTKEGKRNGKFGKIYGGYGSAGHYKAGANYNSFKKDKRLTLIGMSNNINQQNFSSEDLAGLSGGGRGSRRRGGSPLMTGVQGGITNTNSFGTNFTNKIGEKGTFEGSYFFNQTANSNKGFTSRQFTATGDVYDEKTNQNTDNMNHRVNMRITYDINDKNKLIIRPSFSFQDNESINTSKSTQTDKSGIASLANNEYHDFNKSYNFQNRLDFQHKFKKIGRTLSLESETQVQNTNRKNYQEETLSELGLDSLSNFKYLTDDSRFSQSTEITYTEPIGGKSQLGFEYQYDYSDRSSDKNAFLERNTETNIFDLKSDLSNVFQSGYTAHSTQISVSQRGFGKFFTAGLKYEHAILKNDQTYPETGAFKTYYNNILPFVHGSLSFKGGASMYFRYRGNTDVPSVSQLQNVVDRSNTFMWSVGNPDLLQTYNHSLFMYLRKTDVDKGTSITNRISASTSMNYITNEVQLASSLLQDIEVPGRAQISRPINLDGYWNASNSLTYGFPVAKLKSKMNTTLGINYRRLPGLNNDVINMANTYTGNAKFSFVSNISENVDFNIYFDASANTVVNSDPNARANSNYITQTLGGIFNFTIGKGLVIRSDVFYRIYDGVSDDFSTEYTLWNMSVAKKFLKNNMGELELSVFDILKQNTSFSQSVTAAYLQETTTQVLQQYLMLTFTYQIRKFGSGK